MSVSPSTEPVPEATENVVTAPVSESGGTSAPESSAEKGMTPLMQQYVDIKAKYPEAILLFRCGDFYETFFEDAVVAAKELSIVLTARGRAKGEPVPLAGVPYHSAMNYISRLVNKGFTVAICEQLEDPKLAKGLVKRDVVRVMTPGTLSDPQLLDETSNNFLVAFGRRQGKFTLAAVEISTGEFLVTSGDQAEEHLLPEEFFRLRPREILALETSEDAAVTAGPVAVPPWQALKAAVHQRKISEKDAIEALATLFPSEHRARFLTLPPLESRVLGILSEYLLDTQKCSLAHLRFPQPYRLGDGMVLDEATLRNLELLPDGRGQALGGTLFEAMNQTRTSMGARLLKRWLTKPLIQLAPIRERQERVAAMVADGMLLGDLRGLLDRLPDFERLMSKMALGGRSPRDLRALGVALDRLPIIRQRLAGTPLEPLAAALQVPPELASEILRSLKEELPPTMADGGFIADGIDAGLDELRGLQRDGDRWLTAFEERERQESGIKTLRVRKNSVFGYFIEISKGLADKAPAHYVRKQTLTTGERYITAELKEYETKVFSANEKSIALEKQLFETLFSRMQPHIPAIQTAGGALSEIDCLASLAQMARDRGYVRPELTEDLTLHIRGGRHPVVEAFLGSGEFVPNETELDASRLQAIITGPNMAGKSTYLRQNALIVLLAQIGSFVPAAEARIGVVDRIFTRVGAADNLIRGQSTFMVEMMETSSILRHATARSFLIIDEIGRGTSTFDGLSLAWAILEYITERIRARTLFATHYHELTDLPTVRPTLFNLNVAVAHDEKSGNMVFLHQIQKGAANRSYGIEVARLAGLPAPLLDRAREILFELEKTEEEEVGRMTRTLKTSEKAPLQLSLFAPEHELIEAVRNINLDHTTPLEALNLLARLKAMTDA
ncbi:MAG TPA: DNA mismatch repair protein MutS [Candidatus Ozemobacteraceae bacterium]|nr:DNA mismatch repair protein MutS [Candidatus Ozemobacteraceae bacterium]